MASGVQILSGSFIGTGSAKEVRTVGFRPRSVKLWNVSGNCQAVWFEGMADASMQKTVDSGSGTTDISLVASANGITPLSNGFSLGADTDLNVATEIVYYECAQ